VKDPTVVDNSESLRPAADSASRTVALCALIASVRTTRVTYEIEDPIEYPHAAIDQ
jgi:hypothetical protein